MTNDAAGCRTMPVRWLWLRHGHNLRRMTREKQIEIVAQAIRNAFGVRSNRRGAEPREWSDLPEQVRVEFRHEARAAIEAYESTVGR